MSDKTSTIDVKAHVEALFGAGAHYGYSKSRRHPSTAEFIFGKKNNVDIIDLEKTTGLLVDALALVSKIASEGKQILFVGGKKQSQRFVKDYADKINQPYVSGRWIGGTLTNFEEIQKRTKRLETLSSQKEKGELGKYTKKERLLIDREIEKLEERFGGILGMKKKPSAIFIVDPRQEYNAHNEAVLNNIPVIGLCGTDCDITRVSHPIIANDSSVSSIEYILKIITDTYASNPQAAKTK